MHKVVAWLLTILGGAGLLLSAATFMSVDFHLSDSLATDVVIEFAYVLIYAASLYLGFTRLQKLKKISSFTADVPIEKLSAGEVIGIVIILFVFYALFQFQILLWSFNYYRH